MHRTIVLLAALLLPSLSALAQPGPASPPLTAGYGRFFNQSTGSSSATVTSTDNNIQIPVCPAGNCPVPPKNPVLTGSFLGGQTTKGATQAEWLGVDSLYVNTGVPNGQKVGRYIGVTQGPNAGTVWSLNTLTQRGAGNATGSVGCGSNCVDNGSGTIGYELDFTNWDKDGSLPTGSPFTVGMFINTLSSYPSTAGIFFARANGQTVPSWGKGLIFGAGTVQDNTVEDETDSTFSYYVGTGHTHNVAFYDNSSSQYGVQINGNHTVADFWASDNAPAAFKVNGNHTVGLQLATAGSLTHGIEMATGTDICFNTTVECINFDAVQGIVVHTAGIGFRVNGPFNVIPGAAGAGVNGAANLIQAQDGGSGAASGGNLILQAGAGTGGAAYGSIVLRSPLARSYERKVPTAGTTVSYADGKEFEVMVPAATLATLTVQLPSCGAARDGQVRGFSSSQVITALTVSGASGATVLGAPTTLTATQPGNRALFMCVAVDTTWYPY